MLRSGVCARASDAACFCKTHRHSGHAGRSITCIKPRYLYSAREHHDLYRQQVWWGTRRRSCCS